MKKLFRLQSIRMKILLGFAIVIVLVAAYGVFNFWSTAKSNQNTEEMVDRQIQLLIADEKMAAAMSGRIAAARGYVLFGDDDYKELFDQYTKQSQTYESMAKDLRSSEEFNEVIHLTDEWHEYVTDEVIGMYDRGQEEQAKENLSQVNTSAREIIAKYEELAAERENKIEEMGQTAKTNGKMTMFSVSAVTILVIIVSVIAAFMTSHAISKPVKTVMERMKAIAGGDLSHEPLQVNASDEIGQLVHAANEMNQKMRDLLNRINAVSETVAGQSEELTQSANEVKAGAEQVATTMQELASGSETQANSASELSANMQTFVKKMEEANNSGDRIEKSSEDVLAMTHEGSHLMDASMGQMAKIDTIVHQAVEKVKGLDAHSQEISKLVSIIKDIAEQTNLLALNAAIEAARAGEHGQGFAVVADEVRKLAEQVAESVTDITRIVTNIQSESTTVVQSLEDGYQEVEQGTSQIQTIGEKFHGISNAVKDMTESIKMVSDNLASVTASSEKMNSSIQEIAAISEESAAGIEETSASSQQTTSAMEEVVANTNDLAKQAEELYELVRQFKL